jgi:hypothetical protein
MSARMAILRGLMLHTIAEVEPSLQGKQKELAAVFDVPVFPISILILSEDDFSRLPQPSWVVGFAVPRKRLIIIKEQETSGRNREDWLKVIVHEMVHLFYLERFESPQPMWLYEGLACYLAGQKKQQQPIDIKMLLKYQRDSDEHIYSVGYSAVKKLLGE